MNRKATLTTLLGATVIAILPVAAAAQSRSMIPPETLETTLQRQDAMFSRLDLNHDNSVTQTELEAAAAQMRGQGGGDRPERGQGQGRGGAGGPPRGAGGPPSGERPAEGARGGFMARMMQETDTDGDGQISRAEMRASATQRFNEMDKNGDGVLSPDERPQGRGPGGGARGGQAGQSVQVPMGDGPDF